MEEKKEIKVRLGTVISIFIIFILIIALGIMYYFGFVVNKKENISNENVTQDESIIKNEIDENEIIKNEASKNDVVEDKIDNLTNEKVSKYVWEKYPNNYMKEISKWIFKSESDVDILSKDTPKTLYSLSKEYTDFFESPFVNNFSGFIMADGDRTQVIETESNYSQYSYKTNKIKKYSKPITYKIALFNELYISDYNKTIEEKAKIQSSALKSGKKDYHYTDIPKDRKFYYEIPSMLIVNGNNKNEKEYKNNARAKKIKVTIDKDKEYTFDLKDTNAVQIFDIDYKQNSIDKPVSIKIEVLEKYSGAKSQDVYIADVQFSINSNIPQGL